MEEKYPLHDTQVQQVTGERMTWFTIALVCFISIMGGFTVFLVAYWTWLNPGLNKEILLGLNATTVVLILACAYFFAYRFFDDNFYLFIAIAWFANACYLPFEFLFNINCKTDLQACFRFAIYTYILSLLSAVPVYLAARLKQRTEVSKTVSLTHFFGFLAGLVLTFVAFGYLTTTGTSPAVTFAICTIPGVFFTMYSLAAVGRTITRVLKSPREDRTFNILAITFYLYAILQIAYPFKLFLVTADSPYMGFVFFCFFVIAVLIKLVNLYCLIRGVLTVTYPQITAMQERLREENRLAALGAIAAAIEHDMKTPLASMSTKLATMKHLFQEARIQSLIDKLEVDKNRIAAIAKIVPYMRGGDEYYDRDKFMGKVSITEVVNLAIKLVKNELQLDPRKYFFRNRNTDYWVRAYSPMLQQVIVNILKNGVEAIHDAGKDGGAVTITINAVRNIPKEVLGNAELKPYGKWIRVEIEDNGCGIVKENLSKLTTLFTTKLDRKANSGIGLFMASRIVKIHDGTMHITSVENKGTIVSLYLPEWAAYQNLIGELATRMEPESSRPNPEIDVEVPDLLDESGEVRATPNEA